MLWELPWKLTQLELPGLWCGLPMLSLAKWSLNVALPCDLPVTLRIFSPQ